MSKAFNIATNLGAYQSAFDSSGDLTAPNITADSVTTNSVTTDSVTTDSISAANNVNVGNINVSSSNHTWTLKGIDAPIGDSQTGTTPDTTDNDSGQLAIYNGATKLWGITEGGLVQNPNAPAFLAFLTSNYLSVTDNTTEIIPFNDVINDNMSSYDTATYKFTAPIDGLYYFTSTVSVVGGDVNDDTMFWGIYKNSSTYIKCIDNWRYQTGSTGLEYVSTVASVVECSAGDYIDIRYNGIQTAVITVRGSYSWFSGFLIG